MSITLTSYGQLFYMKVFCTAFLCLQFGFAIFWHNEIGAKATHKILMQLTTGVNFTNIFSGSFQAPKSQKHKKTVTSSDCFCTFVIFVCKFIKHWWNWQLQGSISPTCQLAAFALADPKSTKRQSHHQIVFALLWSLCVKAVRQTLVKLTTTGVNSTNKLTRSFCTCRSQKHKKTVTSSVCVCTLWSLCVKAVCKTLVKCDAWKRYSFWKRRRDDIPDILWVLLDIETKLYPFLWNYF